MNLLETSPQKVISRVKEDINKNYRHLETAFIKPTIKVLNPNKKR